MLKHCENYWRNIQTKLTEEDGLKDLVFEHLQPGVCKIQ